MTEMREKKIITRYHVTCKTEFKSLYKVTPFFIPLFKVCLILYVSQDVNSYV